MKDYRENSFDQVGKACISSASLEITPEEIATRNIK